jgi:hypothetical protein
MVNAMMHKVTGACHCRSILIEMQLTAAPETYHPRACDCDFCRKHAATYVSDPQGILTFHIDNVNNRGKYVQGSEQAELLLCKGCGVLMGALYLEDGRLYGTVNARVVDAGITFGTEQTVSPKTLSPTAKAQRWRELWFANTSMRSNRRLLPARRG